MGPSNVMRQRVSVLLVAAGIGLAAAGCSSTEETITPLASDVDSAGAATNAPATASAPAQARTPGSIRFTPVIGAPIEAVTPLSRQLAKEAAEHGLSIRPTGDTGGDQVLKGYFSAFNDGSQTTIVYVWDVLDPAGNRLHRIQGQENIPGAASDAWASVPAATMEQIATKVFGEYRSWLDTRPS